MVLHRAAKIVVYGVLLVLVSSIFTGIPSHTSAQGKSKFFPETGQTVSGAFLDYWQQHGGLAQQGYPLSGEFTERSDLNGQSYRVQYFERAVFEQHPENNPPFDVLLSQLGTTQYDSRYGSAGAPNQKSNSDNPRKFDATGKTIGGKFRTYWEKNGGLAQQGYPISDEFQEKNNLDGKTYTVQYFERAVFELHPENQPPFDVLLSQLGTFQLKKKYPSGTPDNAVGGLPIVSLQASCLLGGSAGARWVQPEAMGPALKGGEKYNLFELTKALGSATGSKAHTSDGPCSETQLVDIATPANSTAVMAVGGGWNAQPRVPRVESTNQDVYRQAVADILKANGLPNSPVQIQQILRVDLEGDGESEVLVTARHYANPDQPSAAAGDYSVVFLRKVINGKVQTFLLGGDFYRQAVEFGAPLTYTISAVLDLNGDGTMEIILYSSYYEGISSSVFQVKGDKVEEVLYCGCGA